MFLNKKKLKLVTHDASFHTDDIFAAATFSIYFDKLGQNFEITRTRDEKLIKEADYVFDVGGIYDADKNRFDHHQVGGAGVRAIPSSNEGQEVSIEYASFGLVWKKFGIELCGNQKAADMVDKKLAAPVDAWDNAFDLVNNKYSKISPFLIQHAFFSMEPTWREENLNINDMFFKCVEIAKQVLSREIIQAQDAILAEEIVTNIYHKTQDKRILIIDKNYPFQHILNNFPEPIYVVYPRKNNNWWGVKAVREDPKTFKNRKNLPASWGGVRDEALQRLTGVPEAIFCHKGLYMCVVKTKEGAIKLAQIALES